jgi:hypothetical protein
LAVISGEEFYVSSFNEKDRIVRKKYFFLSLEYSVDKNLKLANDGLALWVTRCLCKLVHCIAWADMKMVINSVNSSANSSIANPEKVGKMKQKWGGNTALLK